MPPQTGRYVQVSNREEEIKQFKQVHISGESRDFYKIFIFLCACVFKTEAGTFEEVEDRFIFTSVKLVFIPTACARANESGSIGPFSRTRQLCARAMVREFKCNFKSLKRPKK